MLKDEIEKDQLKKPRNWPESTRVNMPNPWPRSWDQNNSIKNKLKQIIKPGFQFNLVLKDEVAKKLIKKEHKKMTRVN
jgi:hypothetical protein